MNDTEMVIAALENPNYDWRTIEGIAKETKLSPEKIRDIIKTLNIEVIRSYILDEEGRPLYTTRKHYKETRSMMNRFVNIMAGQQR